MNIQIFATHWSLYCTQLVVSLVLVLGLVLVLAEDMVSWKTLIGRHGKREQFYTNTVCDKIYFTQQKRVNCQMNWQTN